MNCHVFVASMMWVAVSSAKAVELPVEATDYYSLQIVSGSDQATLEQAYQRHAHLPFVRIEKRGTLYTLRAGFWMDKRLARQVLSEIPKAAAFVRIATFKPDSIVKRNWNDLPSDEKPRLNVREPASPAGPLPEPKPMLPAMMSRPTTDTSREVLRAFNQDDFLLAFDALVSSGDLERALRIAEQAVKELPTDLTWRRKLAQVADWMQRPTLAGAQWQALFSQGDRSDETVSAVIRLAPILTQPATAMLAWEYRASRSPLNDAQWADMFSLYESLTQPDRGSRFFEAQSQKLRSATLLEYAARLAANGENAQRAQDLYLQRLDMEPFSMDILMRVVVQFIRQDQGPKALAVMQAQRDSIPAESVEFWRLLGQLAWLQNDFVSAEQAYGKVAPLAGATAADWSRLVFLVRQQHPAQAAELAWEAYRRFQVLDQLKLSLEIYAGLGEMPAQARIFTSLNSKDRLIAEKDTRFLLMRSQFHRLQKKPDLAWADLTQALALSPDDVDVILSATWFLVDELRMSELSRMLASHAEKAVNDSRYWMVFAAANQVLDRTRETILWYQKVLTLTPDDPLLLLNFADAVERSQNIGMAARIRRHAWVLLKQKLTPEKRQQALPNDPEMMAEARLAVLNQPGDPGLQRVRELVSQLRGVTAPAIEISQLNSLILGWAILKEQYPNARSWMWLRYARQSKNPAPIWGESQVALQLDDTEAMANIMARNDTALPVYNKYDTAYALGNVQQALDTAFTGMSKPFGDEPLYDRFRQHAPLNASYVQLLSNFENSSSMNRHGLQFEGRLILQPKLHAIFGWSRMRQSSSDVDPSALTMEVDRLDSVTARWLGDRGTTSSATLFRRNERQATTGLRLTQNLQWGRRVSLDAGVNLRTDSTISQPMSVAGYESRMYGNLNYALGKREYLRFSPEVSRYFTQYGDYLGAGRSISVEAGYRVRTEYPDWLLRLNWTRQIFNGDGSISSSSLLQYPEGFQAGVSAGTIDPVRYFLPEGSATWGACVSMGENLGGQSVQTGYSKAWRPFMDVCLSHNSVAGVGYSGLLGVAGSLTGEDHLSLQWQGSDGTTASSSSNRSLSIRYRYYF